MYRRELDGLRAIAIIAVILYHAKINIFGKKVFTGGFIGVDIFFVISGYLITLIILKELILTGKFSFQYFYERRIRRILPALLFVILISLPLAWIYLLPNNLIDFSTSIMSLLGFSSNFYFYYSAHRYGADDGILKPFLHTWSLSVEEQYYIIFPVILFITFKYFKKYLIKILFLGFIISLLLADFGSRNLPLVNFYFLPTRAWEFLAGSILAYYKFNNLQKIKRNSYALSNKIFTKIGLLLIIFSIFFFNDNILHPSIYTLLPVTGVCLIIWFSHKKEFCTKILSTKLFVGLGLISYSLYLWHFPIFAFDKIIEFTQGNISKHLLIGLLLLFLSIITHHFIEQPCRNKKNNFRIIFLLILFTQFFLFIFNFNIKKNNGYALRVPEILNKDLGGETYWILKNSRNEICHDNKEGCIFYPDRKNRVILIGDSIIGSIAFSLKDQAIEKQYTFVTSTFGDCIYFPGFDYIDRKAQVLCSNNYYAELTKKLEKENNSIIIIGGRFASYLDNQDLFISAGQFDTINRSFASSVKNLAKKNKIILIYPIPEYPWNVKKKLNILFSNLPKSMNDVENFFKNFKYFSIPYTDYKLKNQLGFNLLDSIQNDNIFRVYPHKLFCDELVCIAHDDKNIFFSDQSHPSVKGAQMISKLIINKIDEIVPKN